VIAALVERTRARKAARAGVLLFALAGPACARHEPTAAAPAADAGVKAKPVDHLAPGELVEGSQRAFGLVLPRLMPIERTFDDVVFASGSVPAEAASRYVEARVRDGKVHRVGATDVFEAVHVPGEPKLLRIVVERATNGGGTRLEIRDVTPLPAVNVPADEEGRWRAVGMKPNGEPLDRTKLR
jgi:hypothetical protein